jgi:cytochrome c-type biogenesis protein CcmH
MQKVIIILLLSFFLLLSFSPNQLVLAQEGEEAGPSDDEVNAIAKQLYCPVCENIPLDVCPTQACAQWRELIREKLIQGWSEQQIKNYFVEQYGDRVLGTPPARGFNWVFYFVPPLAIAAGIVILILALRSMRQRPVITTAVPVVSPEEDKYILRLEEELRKKS